MSESPRMLRVGLRGLALVGVAWASLHLALLVAELRFHYGMGQPLIGSLARSVGLVLIVGAGVWLYGRSDAIAAGCGGPFSGTAPSNVR